MSHAVVSQSEDKELSFSTCLKCEPCTETPGGAVNLSESQKKLTPVANCSFNGLLKTKGHVDSLGACVLGVFSWK